MIGDNALYANTTASNNTGIGFSSNVIKHNWNIKTSLSVLML